MLTLTFIILVCVIVFAVSIASPAKGIVIQDKSYVIRLKIQKFLASKTKVIRKVLDFPAHASHKTVHGSAEAGKKANHKLKKILR